MDDWQDLSATVAARLERASWDERGVFAAGVAERLMRAHEALPEDERAPFTVGLRPLLDAVWSGVLGDTAAFDAVKRGVAAYLLSEYCHNDGQDGPADADDSAAAATLYAAHTHLYGCSDFAVSVSTRAVEAVDEALERPAEGHHPPDLDAALRTELRRQLHDLDLITAHAADLHHATLGLPAATRTRLHATLRAPLSRPT